MYSFDEIKAVDPEIAEAIVKEQNRQNDHIELIASENWVSKAVMAAMGSPLTNKYAEGYPGKRYYGGCQCVHSICYDYYWCRLDEIPKAATTEAIVRINTIAGYNDIINGEPEGPTRTMNSLSAMSRLNS